MTIPIPAQFANAASFNPPTTAIPTNLLNCPPEGMKCVPMQLNFVTHNTWLIDLSVGAPTPPLSQCCALYIDCTNSSQNATIFFADTGYQVQCATLRSLMIPVLTGKNLPKFFVSLPATNSSDLVNIFAINQFVAPFSAP